MVKKIRKKIRRPSKETMDAFARAIMDTAYSLVSERFKAKRKTAEANCPCCAAHLKVKLEMTASGELMLAGVEGRQKFKRKPKPEAPPFGDFPRFCVANAVCKAQNVRMQLVNGNWQCQSCGTTEMRL